MLLYRDSYDYWYSYFFIYFCLYDEDDDFNNNDDDEDEDDEDDNEDDGNAPLDYASLSTSFWASKHSIRQGNQT